MNNSRCLRSKFSLVVGQCLSPSQLTYDPLPLWIEKNKRPCIPGPYQTPNCTCNIAQSKYRVICLKVERTEFAYNQSHWFPRREPHQTAESTGTQVFIHWTYFLHRHVAPSLWEVRYRLIRNSVTISMYHVIPYLCADGTAFSVYSPLSCFVRKIRIKFEVLNSCDPICSWVCACPVGCPIYLWVI